MPEKGLLSRSCMLPLFGFSCVTRDRVDASAFVEILILSEQALPRLDTRRFSEKMRCILIAYVEERKGPFSLENHD
jgi:hypothetical protein